MSAAGLFRGAAAKRRVLAGTALYLSEQSGEERNEGRSVEVRTKEEIHPKVLHTRREPPLPAHPGMKFFCNGPSDTLRHLASGKSSTASSFPLPSSGGTCPLESC